MKENHEIKFPISREFKLEIESKIKQFSPDLKKTSSLKKIFLIGYYHLLENLSRKKNLFDIPLKVGHFNIIEPKKEVKNK